MAPLLRWQGISSSTKKSEGDTRGQFGQPRIGVPEEPTGENGGPEEGVPTTDEASAQQGEFVSYDVSDLHRKPDVGEATPDSSVVVSDGSTGTGEKTLELWRRGGRKSLDLA